MASSPPKTSKLPKDRSSLLAWGARRSIGAKLAGSTVVVLTLVSALLYVELTGRERAALLAAKQTAASMVADLFAASLGAPLDFADADGIGAELGYVKTNPDVTCVTVWDNRDKPVAELRRGDCDLNAPPMPSELGSSKVFGNRVEVARAVNGRAGGAVGKTVLVFSLAHENAMFAASRARIFGLSVVLALGTALLLIGLSRSLIVSRLERLAVSAKRIGQGDFAARVDVTSGDEIGHLAEAFNRMREALADREQRLAAVTQNLRDLFDHMGQAIVAFNREGIVQGAVSREAGKIFGHSELQGSQVRELLYGAARAHDPDVQAFDEWVSAAFDVPLDAWQEFAALAPREVILMPGTDRAHHEPIALELEFRPVAKGEEVSQVMLLATDVSEKRRLEQTVQTQEEEHARRMAAMRRLIAGGSQLFVGFVESARERISRAIGILGLSPRELGTAEIDEIFRYMHTIKGEARAFDLGELEGAAAQFEANLDELRLRARIDDGFATTDRVHDALIASLRSAKEALERGCEVFVEASPIGRAALDQVTVQRSDIRELEHLAAGGSRALARVVERLASRPFGESTASLLDLAPTWADREGKKVHVDVEGREVQVPPALARILSGVMTHLIRNSIAHGIEPADERALHGKPEVGTVRVSAVAHTLGPTIVVEDDGKGLDFEAIAARAVELGIDVKGRDVGELVFVAGLSTRQGANALAGRGVGLDAVRADLEGAGYAVEVLSKPGLFTRFTLRPSTEDDAPTLALGEP